MSRAELKDGQSVWRVRTTEWWKYRDATSVVEEEHYFGPYGTRSAANAQASYHRRRKYPALVKIEARVEKIEGVWVADE